MWQTKYQLKRRYGLSLAEYEAMVVLVRGLLCHGCNTALGVVENDDRLAQARAYLAEWQVEPNAPVEVK